MIVKQSAMKNLNPLINQEGEVREITSNDLKNFKPAQEVFPKSLAAKLGVKPRGPQKSPTKEKITIRLSPDVVQKFKGTGAGWQSRVDAALRDWLKSHTPQNIT
jgi:uncharacterized protein (DUF4415 family)